MKILSKPFVALATQFNSDEFWRARIKLTLLYLLVVAIILSAFSGFLYTKVQQQLADIQYRSSQVNIIDEADAISTVKDLLPEVEVVDVEQEIVDGIFVYVVETKEGDKETDIYINPTTGEVIASEGEPEKFRDKFINDFEENLLYANVLVLILVAFLSYWLAGKTLRPIQKKLQQQEQFSNDVAHEIRTPLSAMLASCESVLRKDESIDVYKESLQDFKNETKRLIKLSEDLLLTAQTGLQPEMQMVALPSVVATVVKRLSNLADKKKISLKIVKESEGTVLGNELLLERLFQNIIHNAIKFTPTEGTVTVTIKETSVSITDTGIGMSAETQARIFDRFYTDDSSRDERGQRGNGLGLSIVEQIATVHQAKISVESSEGKGTTVAVVFLH